MAGLAYTLVLAEVSFKHINIYETASNLRLVGLTSGSHLI